MVKFDASPTLKQGKCISQSSPAAWGKGGSYDTPKQGVSAQRPSAIVTSGKGSDGWPHGGGTTNIGGGAVKAAKPL